MLHKKGSWGVILVIVLGIVLLIVGWGFIQKNIKGILGIKEMTGLSADATIKDADEAFQNKYYDEAIRLYNEALKVYGNEGEAKFRKNKDAIRAQYQIGESYFELQDWENADRAYTATMDNFELDSDWKSKVQSKLDLCENRILGLPY